MLGNHYLKNVELSTTKEGYEQFLVAAEEVKKLSEVTETGWDLFASFAIDKARRISFGQGALLGAAVVGSVVATKEIVAKRKAKRSKK